MASSISRCVFLLILCCVVVMQQYSRVSAGTDEAAKSRNIPLPEGLSWTFYQESCPEAESIVRKELKKIFKQDIQQAGGLLRLHFHDCLVQGCDGSVLLESSTNELSEKYAPPNLSLRARAFEIIDDLRATLHTKCGRVVSCTDIITIAARDSVYMTGGPDYAVPLGRRDGLTYATQNQTLTDFPPPWSTASTIVTSLGTKNLDPTDVVAVSGGHTIGISHCSSFIDRLYPTQDPVMDRNFAEYLKKICPTITANTVTVLDIRSPYVFDNKYYVNLMNRQGVLNSDQGLYGYSKTKDIVTSFAVNQSLFFEKFVIAMTKLGQISVLTGNQGEIRANCSVTNLNNKDYLASLVNLNMGALSES